MSEDGVAHTVVSTDARDVSRSDGGMTGRVTGCWWHLWVEDGNMEKVSFEEGRSPWAYVSVHVLRTLQAYHFRIMISCSVTGWALRGSSCQEPFQIEPRHGMGIHKPLSTTEPRALLPRDGGDSAATVGYGV
ncbi:hypothetical protein E5D57_000952 [Metarhizium anisopliae]|nr:hypothetical protein E5D57_000952 [Metarhizium anisopliae]